MSDSENYCKGMKYPNCMKFLVYFVIDIWPDPQYVLRAQFEYKTDAFEYVKNNNGYAVMDNETGEIIHS